MIPALKISTYYPLYPYFYLNSISGAYYPGVPTIDVRCPGILFPPFPESGPASPKSAILILNY